MVLRLSHCDCVLCFATIKNNVSILLAVCARSNHHITVAKACTFTLRDQQQSCASLNAASLVSASKRRTLRDLDMYWLFVSPIVKIATVLSRTKYCVIGTRAVSPHDKKF